MAKVKNEAATSKAELSSSAEFERTVGKLLSTPPQPRDGTKVGAKPKPGARDAGSTGRKGSGK